MKSFLMGGGTHSRNTFLMGGSLKTLTQLVKSLFANGEQGFFYDPNDLSTMYQDAAGTVPVTAVGQPVGLLLDKSKGVVLGSEKVVNSDFASDTAWVKAASVTISNGSAIFNGATGNPVLSQNVGITAGKWYELTINVAEATAGLITLRIYGTGGSDVILTASSVGVYKVRALARSDATGIIGFSALLTSVKLSSVSVKELAGNHAYQTNPTSRPILRQNATTGANYLEFDGSDDFLQTGNIDFTATDKVSLFAGVRVASAADAMLLEFSGSVGAFSRSFYLAAPEFSNTFGRGYHSLSYGNADLNLLQTAYSSQGTYPDNAVLTVTHDISGSLSTIRRNGVKGLDGTADKGTGNFGNYPLYIGIRGGHSFLFTGHIYGLIGIGRLTSDSETIALEKAIAKNVGVTLNV